MEVTGSDLVSRVLDCDLDTAVARFREFWEQHEHLGRLELRPVEVPPSQWPVFAVFETLSDGKATRTYERARIVFSGRGWDDEGCMVAVRGSALTGFKSEGWGVAYPRALPAISPEAIKSIPEQFALYLERRGIVQPTVEPEMGGDLASRNERTLQDIRNIFAELLEDLDPRRYEVKPSEKLSDETAAYTVYRDGRPLGRAKILVSLDTGHVMFTDMARENGELELDQDWQRIKQSLNRELGSYFAWLNKQEWMQEETEAPTRDDEECANVFERYKEEQAERLLASVTTMPWMSPLCPPPLGPLPPLNPEDDWDFILFLDTRLEAFANWLSEPAEALVPYRRPVFSVEYQEDSETCAGQLTMTRQSFHLTEAEVLDHDQNPTGKKRTYVELYGEFSTGESIYWLPVVRFGVTPLSRDRIEVRAWFADYEAFLPWAAHLLREVIKRWPEAEANVSGNTGILTRKALFIGQKVTEATKGTAALTQLEPTGGSKGEPDEDEQPWMKIPERGWNRLAVRMLHEGYSSDEIAKKTGKDIIAKTVDNRLSELRGTYGVEIVPYRKQGPRKLG